MSSSKDKYLNIFTFYVFIALCLYIAVDPVWHFGMFVNDFRGYYAAAYVFRNGANPYDYSQTAKALLTITGYMGNNPFYYVPWFAWAFVPFTFLSFRISFLVWNMINLVLWFLGLQQIKMFLNLPWSGWKLYSLYIVATLSFAWVTFRYGQIGFVLLVIFLAALKAIQKEQWVLGGVWMALALIKPNVTIVPIGVMCLWLLLRRTWKPVLVVILINLVFLISSLLIMPNWYQPLMESHAFDGINHDTDGPGVLVRDRNNPTMLGVMKIMNVNEGVAKAVYSILGFVSLIAFGIALRMARSFKDITIISVTLWLLVTPYAQTYDYVLLVVVFFFLLLNKIGPLLIKILGLSVVSIAPLFGTTPINSYLMVIFLTALMLVYYMQQQTFVTSNLLDSDSVT